MAVWLKILDLFRDGYIWQMTNFSGVRLGLPHWKFTTENTNRIGPSLVWITILYPYKNRRVNTNMLQMTRRSGFESLKTWPISKINPPETKPWYFILDQFMNWGPLLSDLTSSDWRLRTRIQPSLQVHRQLLTPPRACEVCPAIRWSCWGKKPLDLENQPPSKKDIFLLAKFPLVYNPHWLLVSSPNMVCCWKAPPATSSYKLVYSPTYHYWVLIIDTFMINPVTLQ